MKIEAGYDIAFHFPQETALVLMLSVRPERRRDLLTARSIQFSPEIVGETILTVLEMFVPGW